MAVGDAVYLKRPPPMRELLQDSGPEKLYHPPSSNLAKETHILASNLDQVLLMITLNHLKPRLNL